ncbi:MAG TPA: chorismate synthase [Bacteroidales bacterium]|nr:chorismate synthase [Bacteroidales bacterium]
MNSFGRLFRVSLYGESHGNSVGIVVDGCPAGIPLTGKDFEGDLRRRQGGAKGTTPRKEFDIPHFMSGLFEDHTTGAPLNVQFENSNTRSSDYSRFRDMPRPGHADFTASQKFGGFEDYRGGGHFSGRLTLGIVSAGVIAKKIIAPVTVQARLIEAGGMSDIDSAVGKAIEDNDSIGGIVECRVRNVPAGLGEPFFDSVESLLAHIVFAIPAIKGIEFGAGFAAARMRGLEHNDTIVAADGTTETNHAGGINGGISNGNEILFRVAVKPASSTSQPQQTLNVKTGNVEELRVEGRHDKCIALRVPPVLEGATAIVLADLLMQEGKINRIFKQEN